MDKLIHNLIQKAKKNKFLAFPALLCVFVLLFAKNIVKMVVDIGHMTRTKKIVAAVMAAVLVIGIVGPLSTVFRSTKVNAGTNPYLADWTDSQAGYYWYLSVQSQGGMEYTINSVQDLYELAQLVNGNASVPGLGTVCDNFYGKTVYFNFTQLDFECKEFPVIGQDSAHPFLGNFVYAPFDESYVDSISTLVADRYYSEDATKQLFGYTSLPVSSIPTVEEVMVNTAALAALKQEQGRIYDFKYDGNVLYLPQDADANAIREYPVFYSYRADGKRPWRGELAYRDAKDQPVNTSGVIARTEKDGTLAIRLGQQASYDIKAYPGWDPANPAVPVRDLTVSVVPRNVLSVTDGSKISIEMSKGETISLKECGITAADPLMAAARVTGGNSVSIAGDNLENQIFTALSYGETKVHISSGLFESDDCDIVIVVNPPVDSIRWTTFGGVKLTSDDAVADYVVYYDATDGTKKIELRYDLLDGNEVVTSDIPISLVEIDGIVEDVSRYGNAIHFEPSAEHYKAGDIITITARYGSVESSISILVAMLNVTPATPGDATPGDATPGDATEDIIDSSPQDGGEEAEKGEAKASARESGGEVNADFGNVVQRDEEAAVTPFAETVYQGSVFGVTNGTIQFNRYHKVTVNANNNNGRYTAAVADKDGESHFLLADNGIMYVKNDCNYDLQVILEPTYEIRGNVVIYPVNPQNTSIEFTGVLLEKSGESMDENRRKTCSYVLNSQGAERYQDCIVTINDIKSTNTNISEIVLNGKHYPLNYTGASVGTDYYTVDVKYADFPSQESDITEDVMIVTESVQELHLISVQINEDATVCTVTGYIRPQDGLTVMANFNLTINRLDNDEAYINKIYIEDELICDFEQPDPSVMIQEPVNDEGITVCKIVYKGSKNLTDIVESDIRLDISENAIWSGVMQEGVVSPHLFLNKYEVRRMVMFDVMVKAQDGQNHTKYRIVLQSEDVAGPPSSITVPDKVQYDPLEYQYIITDILQNADYCVSQTELLELAGGDGEEYVEAQQNILRDKAQLFVERDLLIYNGLQVNVMADVEYSYQYIPAKKGTLYGAPGPDGEDGVYYFKAYITSSNGVEDIIWEPISGKVTVRAAQYVPAEIESVDAVNGNINVVLKNIPTECDLDKFEVEYSVDVLDANNNVQISGQRIPWGQLTVTDAGDGRNYAIATPVLGQREQKQRVTVYVRYHYDSNTNEPYLSDSYEIEANDRCMMPQSTILDRDGNVLGKTGLYEKTVYVSLTSSNGGVENDVYYYIDGAGNTNYKKYEEPIEISATSTIHAYAVNKEAYMGRSEVLAESYVIRIPVGTSIADMVNQTGSPAVTADGMRAVLLSQNAYLGKDVGAIKLWLEVCDWRKNATDLMLSQDEKVRMQAKVLSDYCKQNNFYDYCTYDIRLMRTVTDPMGYEIAAMSGEITSELPAAMRITLILPAEIQNRTDLQVLRIHTFDNGTIRVTSLADKDNNPNTYTFETDMMSLYAVVAKMDTHMNPPYEEPTQSPAEPPTQGGNVGDNGDDDGDDDTPSGGGGPVVIPPTSAAAPHNDPSQSVTGNKTGVASGSNSAVSVGNGNKQNPTSAVIGNSNNTTGTSANTTNNAAKTGDKSPIVLLVIVLIVSLILMITVFIWGLKRRK